MGVIERILMKKKSLHYPVERPDDGCLSEMGDIKNEKLKNGVWKKKDW